MQNISRENADIIGEVANICIGNAATTLSMILQKPTNITTPQSRKKRRRKKAD